MEEGGRSRFKKAIQPTRDQRVAAPNATPLLWFQPPPPQSMWLQVSVYGSRSDEKIDSFCSCAKVLSQGARSWSGVWWGAWSLVCWAGLPLLLLPVLCCSAVTVMWEGQWNSPCWVAAGLSWAWSGGLTWVQVPCWHGRMCYLMDGWAGVTGRIPDFLPHSLLRWGDVGPVWGVWQKVPWVGAVCSCCPSAFSLAFQSWSSPARIKSLIKTVS